MEEINVGEKRRRETLLTLKAVLSSLLLFVIRMIISHIISE